MYIKVDRQEADEAKTLIKNEESLVVYIGYAYYYDVFTEFYLSLIGGISWTNWDKNRVENRELSLIGEQSTKETLIF